MGGKKTVRSIAIVGLMAAMLTICQLVLAGIPNIELVSFLIIMFSLYWPAETKYTVAVFVLLQGLMHGFHTWWLSYTYIWYILLFAALGLKKHASAVNFALLSGFFGLFFGLLSSVPNFFISGLGGWLAYVLAGIYFDIAHCIGNFFIMLVLYTPVKRLFLFVSKQVAMQMKKR